MIAKQISTKNSGHGLVPLWQCTRQRGWIRSQILNNQFREREKVESTYFAAMEYSALYSCNFCKFNPVKWSSLILPVPKRVSFSVLMGYLVTMSCVPCDNLCWRFYFCCEPWESRDWRVCQCCGEWFVCHKGLSAIRGLPSASLLSVQTVHPHQQRRQGVSVFFPLQHWQQLAVVSCSDLGSCSF